jgi:hypothetical protein
MKQLLFRPLLLLALLAGWGARAQTLLQSQSFENGEAVNYTATSLPQDNNTNCPGNAYCGTSTSTFQKYNQFFQRVTEPGTASPPNTLPISPSNVWPTSAQPTTGGALAGAYFWAADGTRGGAGVTSGLRPPSYFLLNSTSSVAGKTNLQVKVALLAPRYATDGTAAYTKDDTLKVQVRLNGTGGWTTIGSFVSDLSVTNTFGNMRQVESSSSNPGFITNTFADFTFDVGSSANSLETKILISSRSNQELAFDNIRVYGTTVSGTAPVVTNVESSDLSYAEGAAATAITSTLTVSDADSPLLSGGKVQFTNGFISSEDQLLYTNQPSITGSYNTSTGVLTLSGSATPAAYQAALRSVRYQNTNAINAKAGDRVISFAVTDPTNLTSSPDSRTIMVTTALDAASPLPYAEDLESNGEGTRYASDTYAASNGSAWLRTSANPYSPTTTATTFKNISQSNYWYGTVVNNSANPNTPRLGVFTTKQVNTAGYSNLKFSIRLGASNTGGAAAGNSQGSTWTTSEYFKLYYRVAGSTTWTAFGSFRGTSAGRAGVDAGVLRQDSDPNATTGAPAGTATLSPTLTNFDFALPSSLNGQTLDFQLVLNSLDITNDFAFDLLQLTGTLQTTVNSITRASASPTNAATVNYTVTFGAPVTGLTASNFSLTTTGSIAGATVGTPVAGTGNTWTVPVNIGAGSGTLTLNLANDTGLSYDITTPLPFAGEIYTIDKTAPTVTTVEVPANGINGTGQVLTFTVNFSEAVTVTGTPQLGLTIGSTSRQASYVSGSGSTALVFHYTVQSGDLDADGITLASALALNGGTLRDAVGNDATLTLNGVPSTAGILVDAVAPTATISSTAGGSGSITGTSPIPFTVTFSKSVTGFVQGGLTVTGGSISGFSGSGSTYTFNVTPSSSGTTVTVNVAASVAQDGAGNGNTAASQFSITYRQSLVATAQNVTVNLDANGNATMNASSVNNGSSGSGTLTYTIQKIVYGQVNEPQTLTLATPNGANFTAIRFASYGTPIDNGNGNYAVNSSCNAANSVTTATNSFVGRSTGSMDAQNVGSLNNNPQLGDPCSGTPESLAVQAAYSADAASLTYNCSEAGKTQYVLLTVSNGSTTSTSVAQVTVNPSPTATISNVSPNSAPRGTTVTVTGTNLSGVSGVTVNGATATISGLTSTGFTFVVPTTATFGTGTLTVTASCSQTLSSTFTVQQLVTAAPVVTAPSGFVTTSFPTYSGTAAAGSTVTVYVNNTSIGTTTANSSGNWSLTQPSRLADGPYTVYATAQSSGSTVSANSNTNTFVIDTISPTVTISSSTAPNGSTSSTSPLAYTVTFSESVTGFVDGDVSVTNGTISGFTGAGTTYTFNVTPAANGAVTVDVPANVAEDRAGNGNDPASQYRITYMQLVTAAPVVTAPANSSFATSTTPTYSGTAMSGSTVTVFVDNAAIGTTTASGGSWSLVQPTALAQGSHTVYATAQASGAASANSATNTFTVDSVQPSVAISSTTATSGSSTTTTPFAFTVTFSESVTGFVDSDMSVTNGTVSNFSGSGTTYTFTVTPNTAGTATTVNVAQNVAQDQALNGNTAAASAYSLTFVAPTITVAPATLPNGTQSTAYSQTLTASGGTAPYRFTITAGALPTGLTLASTGTLAGTPTASGSFNFTVTAADASAVPGPYSGTRSYTLTIAAPAVTAVTWIGAVSTDWFTAANWSPNTVPDATINATIPGAPSGGRFPAITGSTANAQARNLTVNGGASLTQTDGTLTLAANFTNNGTFQPTGGTVNLGSSTLSNILGSSAIRFWNLTVGTSGARLSTSIGAAVQRLLTLDGNFSTNGNAFTLESNARTTAMIVNNGSNVVNGNVTVQRYIDPSLNPSLGYRHFSSPIGTATVASLATASFAPVVNPDYNTLAVPGQARPFPTVFGYDQSRLATATNALPAFDKGWFSPSTLNDPLTVGQGYAVLLAANQTFSLTGTQNNGNVTLSLSRNTGPTDADAGLALVGNPYPSPLDWQQVAMADRPGLDGVIYVFASNDPASPYTGSYRFYNNGIGTISPVLPLGQGFFVRVTQGQSSATLTLKNSHRPITYSNATYLRTAETRPLVQLTLKGTGSAISDDAFVYFEQGSSEGFDAQYDAVKIPNPNGLNLSTSTAGQQFSIDGRPALGSTQRVIPLAVGVPAPGTYSFITTQLLNLDGTPVYLRDVQLGTLTDLRLTPSYQFTVADASALITGRFELLFSPQQPLATVPAAPSQQVALYPNPAKKAAFVELPASLGRQAVTATMVDAVGRQVRTVILPAQGALAHQLDLSELATGVYALRLSTSSGVVVKRLSIE